MNTTSINCTVNFGRDSPRSCSLLYSRLSSSLGTPMPVLEAKPEDISPGSSDHEADDPVDFDLAGQGDQVPVHMQWRPHQRPSYEDVLRRKEEVWRQVMGIHRAIPMMNNLIAVIRTTCRTWQLFSPRACLTSGQNRINRLANEVPIPAQLLCCVAANSPPERQSIPSECLLPLRPSPGIGEAGREQQRGLCFNIRPAACSQCGSKDLCEPEPTAECLTYVMNGRVQFFKGQCKCSSCGHYEKQMLTDFVKVGFWPGTTDALDLRLSTVSVFLGRDFCWELATDVPITTFSVLDMRCHGSIRDEGRSRVKKPPTAQLTSSGSWTSGPSVGNGQTMTLYDTFGNLVQQAAVAGVWSKATFDTATPPLSKGVGKVLAKAYNGILDPHGWDQPLDIQDLAMKQPMEHCVGVDPGNLPWPVAVSQEGYPYLLFGKWRHKYKERVHGLDDGQIQGFLAIMMLSVSPMMAMKVNYGGPRISFECLGSMDKVYKRPRLAKAIWPKTAINKPLQYLGRSSIAAIGLHGSLNSCYCSPLQYLGRSPIAAIGLHGSLNSCYCSPSSVNVRRLISQSHAEGHVMGCQRWLTIYGGDPRPLAWLGGLIWGPYMILHGCQVKRHPVLVCSMVYTYASGSKGPQISQRVSYIPHNKYGPWQQSFAAQGQVMPSDAKLCQVICQHGKLGLRRKCCWMNSP
ncbi:hypothetical protein COCSUDRAFT_45605 [Coccomyxa subellipsoidea C-169]|uniref:CxC3 like cysteine cluster domain-containing protein n=1 Tax=Coccomyxa subellipsoidea (strain C-169) TaxID=574566 RepID=I0YI41_COCSC|nr:hypothetical protein COCSUDRAFT_45605 [Coccomyxa subellipsoidea C-169]EIE18060.1 hypothetical protein COCSUDRAFT_45605 [Coccomyxa subellipsoidea C-169]|eukprot:XP_005642604.1 hypothetical protein COCSUDRAFT_45605 [Coccomyxa subellipsoidea C-169]